MKIKLDPLKTPQQNAAQAYKEYRKAETAERHLKALIAEGEERLDYLESVLDALARVESERDVQEIRSELMDTGVIKSPRGSAKRRKIKPAGPLHFVSSTGYEILVGRNNAQNDELTTKTARRTDMWLARSACTARMLSSAAWTPNPTLRRWLRPLRSPRTTQRAASLARCRWTTHRCAELRNPQVRCRARLYTPTTKR